MRASGLFWALLIGCGGGGTTAQPDMAAPHDFAVVRDLVTPPDLTPPPPCDPIQQDCATMAKPKCTVVDDGNMTFVTDCVAGGGAAKDGDPCARTNDMVGIDDCDKGLFCSGLGNLVNPPMRHCRHFCTADGDCMNARCSNLTAAPAWGLCIPTCAPFGTDCANGLDCANLIGDNDMATFFLGCRGVGMAARGQPCTSDLDCAADLLCLDPNQTGSGSCFALCDQMHPCAMGTCTAIPGFANAGGFCK